MRPSGYTDERAAPHDADVQRVLWALKQSGYPATELDVDGHRPDIKLLDGGYIEVKTKGTGNNLAIELNDITAWKHIEAVEQQRIYIVHKHNDQWLVNTPDTLRIIKGPMRPTGNGSNDDWNLYHPDTGTPFADFFRHITP